MLRHQNCKPTKEIVEPSGIEEMENLVGFFDLLIAVDKRINPEQHD